MNEKQKQDLRREITRHLTDGRITCEDLLTASSFVGVAGAKAREEADGMNVKVYHCQLGLFGWEGEKPPAGDIPREVSDCILAEAHGEIVSCPSLFSCAERYNIPRKAAGGAADALNLKVRGCQLGIF